MFTEPKHWTLHFDGSEFGLEPCSKPPGVSTRNRVDVWHQAVTEARVWFYLLSPAETVELSSVSRQGKKA